MEAGIYERGSPDEKNRQTRPSQPKNRQPTIQGIREGIARRCVITCKCLAQGNRYFIHILTHQGTRWRGERLEGILERQVEENNKKTYYMACFQVNPNKLLTEAAEELSQLNIGSNI